MHRNRPSLSWHRVATAFSLALALAGCAIETSPTSPGPPTPAADRQPASGGRHLDPRQAERLKVVMVPLLQHMNNPIPTNQVTISIQDDPHINAANAGGGKFYVTSGVASESGR